MNVAIRIKAVLLSLLAILFFFLTIAFLGSDNYKSPKLHNMVQLDKGWTVSYASTHYYPEVLSESQLPVANYLDVFTLTSTLPDAGVDPAILHFRSILSCVDVYLEDELIYSFGHDYAAKGKMLPKFHHFVSLPKDYNGKIIKIIITAQENNAFSGLSPVMLGNEEDVSRAVAQDGRLSLAIGVFLVMMGFVLLTLSPLFIFTGNHNSSIAFSGFLSLLLGFYILCFNDLFWLFSDQPAFYTFLEYISLFSIPAGILGFLTAAGQIPHRIVGVTFWIINVGFVAVTTILHLTNLAHICHFVSWLHIFSVIEGVYIIVTLIVKDYKQFKNADELATRSKSTAMLILGLVLFTGCAVIDIVKFNFLKFISIGEVNTDISFMTVGALFFILCLILNYFYHCIEFISESNMKLELEGLAYSDALTTLSNRSKCELILAELAGDYTIVSIDLDHLKYTNDNYGHSEGDKLISGFANILKNSFTDAHLIGRMGGDEFIIILPYIDDTRVERDISCFTDLMDYRNTTNTPIKYSASYGFTASNDSGFQHTPSAHQVYLLADTRMYKMKSAHHAQTLGRLYDDIIGKEQKGGTPDE